MESIGKRLRSAPAFPRVAPFAVVALLTQWQGHFGPTSPYWVYVLKFVPAVALLWLVRKDLPELSWRLSVPAVLTGIGVCLVWVALDPFYPKWQLRGHGWSPFADFPDNAAAAWTFIALRLVASAVIVPPIEELFYRSFLYRWVVRPDFTHVALGHFSWKPFLAGSIVFGLAHREWLAGILCGMAYQALVCRKGRLGDAVTAHAVTNALLGAYVIWKGEWIFW